MDEKLLAALGEVARNSPYIGEWLDNRLANMPVNAETPHEMAVQAGRREECRMLRNMIRKAGEKNG